MTIFRNGAVALAVVLAAVFVGIGLAQQPGVPSTAPPSNVSASPNDVVPPEIHLPEEEQTPSEVQTVRQIGAADTDTLPLGAKQLGADVAHAAGVTGKGVVVAVLDTGGDLDHRDLKSQVKASRDWTNSPVGARDRNGHGTHCAGDILAAKNDWGIQGIAYDAQLLVGKVLSDAGSGRVDWIAGGIDWATEQGADVISMSLGGAGTDNFIPRALARAEAEGVIVVAASGNDGNNRPVNHPAAYPQCLAIGAIDNLKRLANFSCTGPELFAVAEGVNSRSTWPGDRFATLSGTSMSTPKIAGAAALWVQVDKASGGEKATRPARFREWLSRNVEDLGTPGRDRSFGWGLPKLAGLKLPGTTPEPPTPPVTRFVTEADLTDAAKARLGDVKFRIEILK